VTASVSGSTLTLSNSTGQNVGGGILPGQAIAFFPVLGYAQAGVEGTSSGTYDLTGPDISNGTLGIDFQRNSGATGCVDMGGCIKLWEEIPISWSPGSVSCDT
jgi:hypothetical protein